MLFADSHRRSPGVVGIGDVQGGYGPDIDPGIICLSRFLLLSGHTKRMETLSRESVSAMFSVHRPYLVSLAYRMLGSMADAEDLAQETFLRWEQAAREEIHTPRAFLTTVLTRLAITHLQSARVRREQYAGTWLPEPVVTTGTRDPVELSESLTMAFLVPMESLTPLERAVFLLQDVFDYSHAEIADIVGKTEGVCRQTLRRAKQAVKERRSRFEVRPSSADRLTMQFVTAVQAGNLGDLKSLLHEDIVAYSDGGGRVRAALNPISGKDRVARFLVGIARKGGDGLQRQVAEINAQPGFLGFRHGKAQTAVVLDIEQDRIHAIYIVVNPEKLQHLPKENES
jgi:RNA polymerase sigma-70 factor (ECF subfamily)